MGEREGRKNKAALNVISLKRATKKKQRKNGGGIPGFFSWILSRRFAEASRRALFSFSSCVCSPPPRAIRGKAYVLIKRLEELGACCCCYYSAWQLYTYNSYEHVNLVAVTCALYLYYVRAAAAAPTRNRAFAAASRVKLSNRAMIVGNHYTIVAGAIEMQ
ncbi:unnamed protein product [Trichogramma brassicae]|uniref:Uncharacterized protein n=1 Tax=Trichogramma brassicae TaxID=86971 RepID=A0A6H5I708_9HYME|nr:unnamed protein product [Trichogramma brassicae]